MKWFVRKDGWSTGTKNEIELSLPGNLMHRGSARRKLNPKPAYFIFRSSFLLPGVFSVAAVSSTVTARNPFHSVEIGLNVLGYIQRAGRTGIGET
jgi:hypothetical protein